MADTSKARTIHVQCSGCGWYIPLFDDNLAPHEKLTFLDITRTSQKKTCPFCLAQSVYPATAWIETELP